MKIDVLMDSKIFQSFAVFDVMGRLKRWRYPTLFMAIMLAFSILCFFVAKNRGLDLTLGYVLIAIGILLPFIYVMMFLSSVRDQCKKMGLKKPQLVYSLDFSDDTGFSVDGRNNEHATYSWKDIFAVYQKNEAIYLYVTATRAFILPLAQMPNQSEMVPRIQEKAAGAWK